MREGVPGTGIGIVGGKKSTAAAATEEMNKEPWAALAAVDGGKGRPPPRLRDVQGWEEVNGWHV
ncbi:hypothetical protein IEQ34_003672 [Dendrobium chrysotoxum]|uniref:Uncharacterized protein n=1 Tax=Dendrobium chrysotoxum TaxID=161865 RepID=A0AAV7HEC6_DENCH|nr:hypothetical protein IEQ34_003672 [Dendrobium chrysotoxum]